MLWDYFVFLDLQLYFLLNKKQFMPISETDAFVIGSKPFGEQDKLVYLLTENDGIKKGIAPGANKHKNRFGSVFELFTEGHFIYNWKELKNLITISKGEIISSHFDLVSDSKNIFYFYIIAEILQKAIPENQINSRIYRLLGSIINSRKKNTDIRFLLIYFMIWFLKIEGLMFNPYICYNCYDKNIINAYIRDDYRGIFCDKCSKTEKNHFNEEELKLIKWILLNPPSKHQMFSKNINIKNITNIFLKKIEIHAELSIKSKRYIYDII